MKHKYVLQVLIIIIIQFTSSKVTAQNPKNNINDMKEQNHKSKELFSIPASKTFDGTWPFKANFNGAAGFKMHYIDEGEGEVLLALHGEPTWGYLFRNLIKTMSENHRIIVPDHMGFGKSETPQNRTYFLQDHIDNLEKLVLDLDLKDITLVMHDFGGPVGMGLAIRHPNRIKRIISTNGPTPLGQSGLEEALSKNAESSPWFTWIFNANKQGTLEQVLGQLNYNILSTLKLNGFENNQLITNTWLEAYGSAFKTKSHTLGAIGWAKGFAQGSHKFEPVNPEVAKTLSKKPALVIWGMEDRTLQARYFLPLFQEAFPDGETHRLQGVGHYSLEDAPKQIASIIKKFLEEN